MILGKWEWGWWGTVLVGTVLFDMNLESFLSNFRGSCHFGTVLVPVGTWDKDILL